VRYVEGLAARVALYDLTGHHEGDIPLPTRGSVGTLELSLDGRRLAFTFDSYFHPPTLYGFEEGALVVLDRVAADIDTDAYRLTQVEVPSVDGTPINVFLVHRRDLVHDGTQPVLLSGYGGFSYAMLPGFSRNVLYWLERGGVYAVANIRGGGEYGEEWHQAGMLHNKPNTFADFEAVIRWLGTSGLSAPERIAIIGASNGGLLMGAMLTRCPEAFRAAVASVGLYDMVRFTEFPPAEIWMGEYGNPAEPADFQVLLGYSPYHNVVEGTAYPAVFVDTADQDTRVSWRHSTKFAARLQEATTGSAPILFYMLREQGHGAGTGMSDTVRQYVRYYTFIETELGVGRALAP
jgi:prolyl oligopeptidase